MRQAIAAATTAILLVAGAYAQTRKNAADSADQKELYNYVLTMDKVKKLAAATMQFQELAKKHPELNDEKQTDSKNIDEMVQKLQKYPDVVSILSKNGLTPREYAVGFMTLMQASMAVGFKKSGTYKEYPPKMLEVVSKPNLDFVDQHFDEIQKVTAPLSGEK
jgi:hypothetical protein